MRGRGFLTQVSSILPSEAVACHAQVHDILRGLVDVQPPLHVRGGAVDALIDEEGTDARSYAPRVSVGEPKQRLEGVTRVRTCSPVEWGGPVQTAISMLLLGATDDEFVVILIISRSAAEEGASERSDIFCYGFTISRAGHSIIGTALQC